MFVTKLTSLARYAGCGVVLSSLSFAAPAPAAPPAKSPSSAASKQACLAAHEQAQTLRLQKKLHAARERYVACARAECPVILRQECSEQLDQVEVAAPSIAIEVLDDKGESDVQVKVTLDGQVVAERLTGAAIPVEPGEHVLLFERASDGKTLEQRLLVVEGEKNRKVVADYQALAPKGPRSSEAEHADGGRVPVLAYVAGGVAVAGLGSFAIFSLSGRGTEDDLAKRCAPTCTPDDVSPVKRDYLIADVSLAVAVVAAAAAVVLAVPALVSGKSTEASDARVLRPAPWMPRTRVVSSSTGGEDRGTQ